MMLVLVLSSVVFLAGVASSYDAVLRAGVLGVPGSNDAELYRTIADYLYLEDTGTLPRMDASANATDPPAASRAAKTAGRQSVHCKLSFEEFNFDTTNSTTVYASLNDTRTAFMNDNMSVAVGPFIQMFSSTDYVITQQTHLLTSSAGPNAGLMDPGRVVSIFPESTTLAVGIAALVKRLGWTDVAFLAQDDFNPVLALNQKGIRVWPIRLTNIHEEANASDSHESELYRNLIALRQSERDKFILHTDNRELVLRVLEAAHTLHLLQWTKEWLITYLDFTDVVGGDLPQWSGALYGLQMLDETRVPQGLIDILGDRLSRLDIGLAYDVVGLLRHIMWIEGHNCSTRRLDNEYYIRAEFITWNLKNGQNEYKGALGQYTWDRETNRRTNFTLDILKYDRNFTKLGEMQIYKDIPNITLDNVDVNRTIGEDGEFQFDSETILLVATKQIDPFIIRKGDTYVGFSHDLLHEIAQKCGFKYRLYEVKDYVTPTGQLVNGMVNALTTGDASMAVGAMEVTSERQKVIAFSYTILSSQASILIKKAKRQSSLFQFMSPFAPDLWLMILLFINVATFSLYVMSRYDPSQEGNANRFNLKESLWYGWNIILQGTTDYSPSTTSMRAIIAFFWFCVVIIDAAYTANLAAFRTLQQIDDRIKNLHDLASQTNLLYGVEKGSDIMHFFQSKQEDPFERMWAYMKLNEESAILANTSEIVEKVKDGTMAFIADGVTNDYYVKQHCGIESIEQTFGKKDFSLGFPKGAPYLDNINKALLELKEEGVLDVLKERWWMMGATCTEDDDTRSISQKATAELELESMTGIFIVLGSFVVMALVVGVAEACIKASNKRKARMKAAGASSGNGSGNNGQVGKDEDHPGQPLEMEGNVVENYYTFN